MRDDINLENAAIEYEADYPNESCEKCVGDVGDPCAICGEMIPEPPDGLPAEAWSGGFARNH